MRVYRILSAFNALAFSIHLQIQQSQMQIHRTHCTSAHHSHEMDLDGKNIAWAFCFWFWPVLIFRPITWLRSFYNSSVAVGLLFVCVYVYLWAHTTEPFASYFCSSHVKRSQFSHCFPVLFCSLSAPCLPALSMSMCLCYFFVVWKWEMAVKLLTIVNLICLRNCGNNTVSN